MNRLEAIELFTKVVETGSFTKAAHALQIARASATTRVQSLENRLGVKLLQRTTRAVSLTNEGALYYEECTRVLNALNELESSLVESISQPKGRLRVDVSSSVGRCLLAPNLPKFLKRFPGLSVELGSTDRAVDLVAEGVDCVIRGGTVHDHSLASRKLADLPVMTFAAPSYLRKFGTPQSPAKLAHHQFVNFFSAKTGMTFEVDFEKGDETVSCVVDGRVSSNDTDTWLALAVAGLGLIQVPVSVEVRRLLREKKLQRVFKGYHSPTLPVFLLYPQNRRLPARVRVFIDWVVALYARENEAAKRFI